MLLQNGFILARKLEIHYLVVELDVMEIVLAIMVPL